MGRGRIAALLLVGLCAATAQAQVLAARLRARPEKIYVGQTFDLFLEIDVAAGTDLENASLDGFQPDGRVLEAGAFSPAPRQAATGPDGRPCERIVFAAQGKANQPLAQRYDCVLGGMLVRQQRTLGVIFSRTASSVRLRLEPFTLAVRELPQAGRPAGFSGAIGRFQLKGSLSRSQVSSGDLVTLRLEVAGDGLLPEGAMPAAAFDAEAFKSYAAKTVTAEPGRRVTEQVFIPLAPTVRAVPEVVFSFFDPAAEWYQRVTAGPFALTWVSPAETNATEAVRVVTVAAADVGTPTMPTIGQAMDGLTRILPLVPGLVGVVLACLAFVVLRRRRVVAVGVGLALLVAGAWTARLMVRQEAGRSIATAQTVQARLAPSYQAQVLFTVPQGTGVVLVESADGWLRVEAGGRRGWIPASAMP